MPRQARLLMAVALGAASGSLLRYLSSLAALALLGSGFAWGTLFVNVAGSFLIGLYSTLTEPDGRIMAGPILRQGVLTGFCGGFTTFSVFSLETFLLLQAHAFGAAALNVAASVLLWLVAVWVGYRIGTRLNRLKGS